MTLKTGKVRNRLQLHVSPVSSPYLVHILEVEKLFPAQNFDDATLANMYVTFAKYIKWNTVIETLSMRSAFLSIPDCANNTGDIVYCFRASVGNNPVYGFSFFRQEKNPTLARGFLQKSVILLTHNAQIHLFKEVSMRIFWSSRNLLKLTLTNVKPLKIKIKIKTRSLEQLDIPISSLETQYWKLRG